MASFARQRLHAHGMAVFSSNAVFIPLAGEVRSRSISSGSSCNYQQRIANNSRAAAMDIITSPLKALLARTKRQI
jgi:hypothetical protein